jgi:DNA-binding SARP family transcriptional activator
MTAATRVRIALIGGFALSIDNAPIPLKSQTGQQVLGYLAAQPGQSEARTRLAAMIWEDMPEDRARQNLRQVLHQLRTALVEDAAFLEASREHVGFTPGTVTTDAFECLSGLTAGTIPTALTDGGDLLEDYLGGLDAPGELWTHWRAVQRRDFETALRTGLEAFLECAGGAHTEPAARALIRLDPSDEAATRALITHHMTRGETAKALDAYAALWDHLGEHYDMEPSAQTQALIAEVKSGRLDPPRPSGPAPDTTRHLLIGVLPIEQIGAEPDRDPAAELLRAELIVQMSRFREIEVVDLADRESETAYTLRFVCAPGKASVSLLAILTRTADGAVLWSDRYDNTHEDWWGRQSHLAGRIATSCSHNLARARLAEIARLSADTSAVDAWILGQRHFARFTAQDWAEAETLFRQAIARDPDFSMAYSSLSQLRNTVHLVEPGHHRQPETHAESKALANRAIELDPADSRAHLHRAWASCLLGEYTQASALFGIARQWNPNDAWTRISCALGAAFGNEPDLAHSLADQNIAEGWTTTAPHWGYHLTIRFVLGDYAGCLDAAENASGAIPNIPAWTAAALWHLGQPDYAARAWSSFENAVTPGWAGPAPATRQRVADWFLSCFPIRSETVRGNLAKGIHGAAGL